MNTTWPTCSGSPLEWLQHLVLLSTWSWQIDLGLFLTSGTFDLGLTDHHLDYAVSRSHRPRTFPITGERRTVKNYDPERFCDDLHSTPSDIPYTFEDIDDIYWAWSYLLSSILDNHSPIKRKTANLEHVSFMTPELLEAIRKRNKLKRLYNESTRRLD